jgi:hypothetical protein
MWGRKCGWEFVVLAMNEGLRGGRWRDVAVLLAVLVWLSLELLSRVVITTLKYRNAMNSNTSEVTEHSSNAK